jgi:hypothetical protein
VPKQNKQTFSSGDRQSTHFDLFPEGYNFECSSLFNLLGRTEYDQAATTALRQQEEKQWWAEKTEWDIKREVVLKRISELKEAVVFNKASYAKVSCNNGKAHMQVCAPQTIRARHCTYTDEGQRVTGRRRPVL